MIFVLNEQWIPPGYQSGNRKAEDMDPYVKPNLGKKQILTSKNNAC